MNNTSRIRGSLPEDRISASTGDYVAGSLPASGKSSFTSTAFTNEVSTNFTLNGKALSLQHDPRVSLLDTLRETLALFGAKKGCDHGQCGACTVHVDGRRVASCLTLMAQMEGKDAVTIEGIAGADGTLHPMQQAFIDHDALQCGYCTPGQIMAAIACVKEGHAQSRTQIREYMSGNLCRCGAYVGIVSAIEAVAQKAQKGRPEQ